MLKAITAIAAAAMIPDGASVMFGGFMGVGTPQLVLRERAPGVSVDEIVAATGAELVVAGEAPEMPIAA